MTQITAGEAANILGISKRTLYRWEKEGKIAPIREGLLKIRVYDKAAIEIDKRILDLEEKRKDIIWKLNQAVENEKKVLFVQDVEKVRYGQEPFRLMDMEAAGKAMAEVDKLEKEHREVLDEMFQYPKERIRVLTIKE